MPLTWRSTNPGASVRSGTGSLVGSIATMRPPSTTTTAGPVIRVGMTTRAAWSRSTAPVLHPRGLLELDAVMADGQPSEALRQRDQGPRRIDVAAVQRELGGCGCRVMVVVQP